MGALTQTLNGTDHRTIKAAVDNLNHATEAFAAKRMDASIRKALTGQKLADIGT
jgi:molecular chaperone HscA